MTVAVSSSTKAGADRQLGTFLGVFTPTILTILGVIMYLRSGWIVGHLGLFSTLVIVVLANSITLITAVSFSSVATNIRVGGGGAYYIVSRSLGLEIGGAIGLPLFLSQTFSVTLYSYGLAESLRFVWPDVPVQAVTLLIVILVGFLAVLGARLALGVQIPLLLLVAISLVAMSAGALMRSSGGLESIRVSSGELGFWTAFAVFFPAVTGVMAGLGLSGDLREPGRSIPLGAMLAVLTGFAVYLLVPVMLSLGATPAELREDPLIWMRLAVLGPWLVLPGLWAAIFSSAVGSILGAPRTLQALARDGLAPRFMGARTGNWRELAPGIGVSLAVAIAAVFLGNLNAVATVVTMFFLTVYGTINIAAAVEALSGDPSWRPRFKAPWFVNLAGGAMCAATIFLINPVAGVAAIVIEVALWSALSRRERTATWGDVRRGMYETMIRWTLIRLARRPMSARNWRPHILVFVSDLARHLELVRFGNWLNQGRGVVTACQLVIGDLLDEDVDVAGIQADMQRVLDREGLPAFAEADVVRNVVDGMVDVAQANGMAGMDSNTIMLGWPKEQDLLVQFLHAMRRLERLNKSLIIGRIRPFEVPPHANSRPTVHVWWGGLQRNGDLMLLLAYLLTRNPEWRSARVHVISVASNELARTQAELSLKKLIPEVRVGAIPRVIVKPQDASVHELIRRESSTADVVFMGLATPEVGKEEAYAQRLARLAEGLPTVFFVKNASVFVGQLMESEDRHAPYQDEGRPGHEADAKP